MARESIKVNGVVGGCVAKTSEAEQAIWAKRGEKVALLTYNRLYLTDPKGSKIKTAIVNGLNDALAPFVPAIAGMNPGNEAISGEAFVSELIARFADLAADLFASAGLQNEIVRDHAGLSAISEDEIAAWEAANKGAVPTTRKATTSDDL